MKGRQLHILFLNALLIICFNGCEEPIDTRSISFDDLLVVEGMVTDQLEHQRVKLSRTYPLDESTQRPASNADVQVEVNSGEIYEFEESEPGVYLSLAPFAAEFDMKYRLLIRTSDGGEYASDELMMTPTPPIDSVYAEFDQGEFRGEGDFSFFLDVAEHTTGTQFLRWEWFATYRIKVPNPSRWRWLGGDEFEFRDETKPEEQEEYCFKYDTNKQILLGSSDLKSGEILRYHLNSFASSSKKLNVRYSIKIIQYGLSNAARQYWEAVASSIQGQGSLFDKQPGTIVGNIKSLSDDNETVLGIFEVTQKKSVRLYYRPSDFYSQGYVLFSSDWLECPTDPIFVPTPEAAAFMQENHDKYEVLFFTSTGEAVFGIKRCALCTLYGSNEEPEFWED